MSSVSRIAAIWPSFMKSSRARGETPAGTPAEDPAGRCEFRWCKQRGVVEPQKPVKTDACLMPTRRALDQRRHLPRHAEANPWTNPASAILRRLLARGIV